MSSSHELPRIVHELRPTYYNARNIREIGEIRGEVPNTNNSNRTNNARNIREIGEIRGEVPNTNHSNCTNNARNFRVISEIRGEVPNTNHTNRTNQFMVKFTINS